MKVFIVIFILVGTVSLQEEERSFNKFKEVERYRTVCPANTVMYTQDESEPSQAIEIKRTIDQKNQLLAFATVTHTDSGEIVHSVESLRICTTDSWHVHTWDFFLVRFFKVTMLPRSAWNSCPVFPAKYTISRFIDDWTVILPNKIPEGHYEVSYIIKSSDGEVVFSALEYKFVSTDVTPAS